MLEHQEASYLPASTFIEFSNRILVSKSVGFASAVARVVFRLVIFTIFPFGCSSGAVNALSACGRWTHFLPFFIPAIVLRACSSFETFLYFCLLENCRAQRIRQNLPLTPRPPKPPEL